MLASAKTFYLTLLIVLIAIAPSQLVSAQPASVVFDTVSTQRVGPGIVHTQVDAPSVPWTLDVLEVDLTNSFLEIETAVARGSETTGSMAARNDSAGHRVVGATNGDFYYGGRSTGIHVQDGEIVHDNTIRYQPRPAVGFDPDNRVTMRDVSFSGEVISPDAAHAINGVNRGRGTDQLMLYNQFAGASTGTGQGGAEAAVRPLGSWFANDTVRVVVETLEQGQGDMHIPQGGAVLSGHGTAASFLTDQLSEDDTLRLSLHFSPEAGQLGVNKLEEIISGNPYIVKNGAPDPGGRGDGGDRHPRTAVGFSQDSTTLYMVTVDGRQPTSAGMTLPELGDFMVRIGAHTAMNLDGGGSTTMIMRGDVVNSPSGGTQRAIASNALLAVSTAPTGELVHLQVNPTYQKVFMDRSVQFEAQGADQYYNPIEVDADQIEFDVDPGLGTIDTAGVFTAGSETDTGNVYVSYGDLRDTARVIVKTIDRFDMTPHDVVTDTTQPVRFKIAAYDQDDLQQVVSRTQFTWTSTRPDVGTVDSTGRFRGRQEGTTQVIAAYGELSDTASVTVNVQTGTSLVDAMENADTWQLSGDNVNLEETQLSVASDPKTQGEGALKLDYTYPDDGLHWVFLDANKSITGVPDTLHIDSRSSNTAYNQVQLDVRDAQGHPFRIFSTSFANRTDSFKTLPMAVGEAAPLDTEQGDMYFPIELQRIRIQLRGRSDEANTSYSGTLYLDNLRASYPNQRTDIENNTDRPSILRLLPNHPNPFSERTVIPYELERPRHVRLVVYDVLGRKVQTLLNERQTAGRHEVQLNGRSLPAGVYFYRLQAGESLQTGNATRVRTSQ